MVTTLEIVLQFLELVVFINVAGIDSTQHEDSHAVFMVNQLSVVVVETTNSRFECFRLRVSQLILVCQCPSYC